MLNNQGRPTSAGSAAMTEAHPTFTGNRALMQEEALIFEIGRAGTTGVDLDEPAQFKSRLGGLERKQELTLPGAPLCAPVAEELRHRHRDLPARLLHHEAQSAPQ